MVLGDMGVNLGRGNIHMAQHDLDGSQIRSAFKQVAGKGMAQRMGACMFRQPGKSAKIA